MRKKFKIFKWELYCKLSDKLTTLIPEEFESTVEIIPPVNGDKDLVVIMIRIPRSLTRKLMWHFKVWRKE